ncbi:unnamed protein product [Tuber aestivum]|uniref:HTH La-type RNA-binding domain-containing protein n=1 Tax=Tuber aestivum TaxID=59557 RepID=A0A292PUW0_9PEZI|nr:unnamed protein product [Tuber aestivum]
MGDEVATEKAEVPKVEVEQAEPVEQKPVEDVVEPAVVDGGQVEVESAEQLETPTAKMRQEEPVKQEPVGNAIEQKPAEDDIGPVSEEDKQAKIESAELEDTSATVEEKNSVAAETKEPSTLQKKKRENIKFDATLLPESDDPAEVRKQVEFYFSDSNLPFDKFLFGIVGKDNRAVPLKLICSFKRMRRFTNPDVIIGALRESEALVIAGDVGEETVRRKTPLVINEVERKEDNAESQDSKDKPNQRGHQPAPRQAWDADITGGRKFEDPTVPRSIYAKGFGGETPTTQIDLENFFAPYGPVASVRLRRTSTGFFKGSIFVEFKSEELMKEFMALEEKPKWNSTDLQWLTKKAYCDGKIQDIKDGKLQPKASLPRKSFDSKNGHRGNSQRGRGKGGRGGGRHHGSNGRRGNSGKGINDRGGPPKLKTRSGGKDGIPQVKTNGDAVEAKDNNNNKRKAEDGAEAHPEVKKAKQEYDNGHKKQEMD